MKSSNPEEISEGIVSEIIKDISDRRGLSHEWNSIDEDIQEEIKDSWMKIIKKHMV
jgi:hypothetical protein